jgi:hypothetical protein
MEGAKPNGFVFSLYKKKGKIFYYNYSFDIDTCEIMTEGIHYIKPQAPGYEFGIMKINIKPKQKIMIKISAGLKPTIFYYDLKSKVKISKKDLKSIKKYLLSESKPDIKKYCNDCILETYVY